MCPTEGRAPAAPRVVARFARCTHIARHRAPSEGLRERGQTDSIKPGKALILWFHNGDANVASPDLGQKFLCAECGAKFYDLGKKPPTCPACETVHVPVEPPKPRRTSAAAKKPPPPVAAPKPVEPEETSAEDKVSKDDATDDEADDDVIEDTSEIGEADEDVASVVTKGDKDD